MEVEQPEVAHGDSLTNYRTDNSIKYILGKYRPSGWSSITETPTIKSKWVDT